MNKMKAWQGSYGRFPITKASSAPLISTFDISGVKGDYFHKPQSVLKQYVPFFAQASDGVRIGQWDDCHRRE